MTHVLRLVHGVLIFVTLSSFFTLFGNDVGLEGSNLTDPASMNGNSSMGKLTTQQQK